MGMIGEREWELSHASFLTLGFILHMGNLREIWGKGAGLHRRFSFTSLPPRDFDGGADSAEQANKAKVEARLTFIGK